MPAEVQSNPPKWEWSTAGKIFPLNFSKTFPHGWDFHLSDLQSSRFDCSLLLFFLSLQKDLCWKGREEGGKRGRECTS